MASNTANYGLHQWEATDDFLRTDFNTDFAKIDAALAGLEGDKAEIVFGNFTGDGSAVRTIDLGFTPLAVLVENADGQRGAEGYYRFGGLLVPGHTFTIGEIVSDGFKVYYSFETIKVMTNSANVVNHYIAFRPTT